MACAPPDTASHTYTISLSLRMTEPFNLAHAIYERHEEVMRLCLPTPGTRPTFTDKALSFAFRSFAMIRSQIQI
jgi:hypothetical protein